VFSILLTHNNYHPTIQNGFGLYLSMGLEVIFLINRYFISITHHSTTVIIQQQ